ncbi:cation:proton antiporter, partial [Staphylococcus aureus]|uniref:cation:proton antiporter domain-containing protein n=1 Tax=Staphylococcus aureus TaxID=1280 RepID=UPI001E322556
MGRTTTTTTGDEEEDVLSSLVFTPTLTELFTFGALISSTDPVSTLAVFQAKRVDPQLFYLVFGESV